MSLIFRPFFVSHRSGPAFYSSFHAIRDSSLPRIPRADKIVAEGNAYLKNAFPQTDYIRWCTRQPAPLSQLWLRYAMFRGMNSDPTNSNHMISAVTYRSYFPKRKM
jgi:hypothetical protein